jgi:adenosine deaminase
VLFGSRLLGQYAAMRAAHDLSDQVLAQLAHMSVAASCAPDSVKAEIDRDIDAWLAS